MRWNIIRMMGLFVAVLFGMAGCGGGGSNNAQNFEITTSAANMVSLNQQITVKVGQEVSIPEEGLTLALQSVSEDSRCPEDVVCIWEGNAKVSINITKTGQPSTIIELNTSPAVGPAEETFQTYTVKLTSLAPNNKSGQTINSSDYIASLLVTKISLAAPTVAKETR